VQRGLRRSVVVAAGALVTAGLAGAAVHCRPCHPDLPGTRSFTVHGEVTAYAFAHGRVIVRWVRGRDCVGRSVWNFESTRRGKAGASCQRAGERSARTAGTQSQAVAAQGRRLVRLLLAPPSVDMPDRLEVVDRATNRRLAAWPLIERPTRVRLYGGVAILSSARRSALYALRLSDGRVAMIGITRPNDRPLISAAGVVYEDDLDVSKHRTAPQYVMLKLLPLTTVRRELAHVGRPIRTSRINAMAMDGPRVAFAVHDPRGKCDRVLFWNIPWHFVSRLTQPSGSTCLPSHAPGGITDVAIAGSRAIWTTQYGSSTRVLAASIIKCQEWVVARLTAGAERVSGLSGDGGVLTYGVQPTRMATRRLSAIGIVPKGWVGFDLTHANTRVIANSTDTDRIAGLYQGGTVELVARDGQVLSRFSVGRAYALALRRNTIAVLSDRGRLDLYQALTGRRLHSWRVPARATSIDLHYDIALLTAGRSVYAMNTRTGRVALLVRAPSQVSAQLEAPGAAIQFNVGRHGYLRFIPLSLIESRTT
jgi:hypothetical protein